MPAYPTFDQFLSAPLTDIRAVAPVTFIYAPAGTRRSAVLAGFSPQGAEYVRWTQSQLFRCIDLIFSAGVQHLVMPMLGPSQFSETTMQYAQHLWDWFTSSLAGSKAIARYQEKGWRVRFAFSEYIPQIRDAAHKLVAETSQDSGQTLWCVAVPDYHMPSQWLLQAVNQYHPQTLTEAVRVLYGEEIPPAALYLGSGKPLISSLQLPPLLVSDTVQCYWSQRPGYSLDDAQLRSILYDYAYLRKTWREDKTGRAQEALQHRDAWERGPILGLGKRLGSFWFPASLPDSNRE